MSWFGLEPDGLVGRIKAGGVAPPILSSTRFVIHGAVGFTLVSIAGFAPWALFGRQLHQTVGEVGLYTICAAIFIGLSAPCLHRLILGSGSLARFYALFAVAFTAYAIAWILGWMSLGGHLGSTVGLLAGTIAMAWIFVRAFDATGQMMKVVAALFTLNAVGYFGGGWVEAAVAGDQGAGLFGSALDRSDRVILAKLLWGVCYGLGFGAGLGLAFYYCQEKARALLKN